LFGQTCFAEGDVKTTYGTGCFLLMNIGSKYIKSKNGLVTTLAASSGKDGKPEYALEGSVFVGGAIVQWVRDQLRFIVDASDSEYFATKVKDNGGVYVVPAFTGLGAPYWDMYARGTIFGLTRGSNRNHIIRAALESIAYQVADLVGAMKMDTNLPIHAIKVDGGASKNNFLMQFQSDISDSEIIRGTSSESTALGVYYLTGLAVGLFKDKEEIKEKALEAGKAFRTELANAPGVKEETEAEDDEKKVSAGVDLDADGNVEINESEETKHHGMRR
jgi:glycerol kinase